MGCRTGFYLLTRGMSHEAAIKLVRDAYKFISEFDDRIPGCSEEECGNYKEHNLQKARKDVLPLLKVLENYTVEMLSYSWHMQQKANCNLCSLTNNCRYLEDVYKTTCVFL